MPDHPKTFTEMLGETLREVAVLVIVFVPLDVLVSGRHFAWIWFLATVGISAPLFLMGVALERVSGARMSENGY